MPCGENSIINSNPKQQQLLPTASLRVYQTCAIVCWLPARKMAFSHQQPACLLRSSCTIFQPGQHS